MILYTIKSYYGWINPGDRKMKDKMSFEKDDIIIALLIVILFLIVMLVGRMFYSVP